MSFRKEVEILLGWCFSCTSRITGYKSCTICKHLLWLRMFFRKQTWILLVFCLRCRSLTLHFSQIDFSPSGYSTIYVFSEANVDSSLFLLMLQVYDSTSLTDWFLPIWVFDNLNVEMARYAICSFSSCCSLLVVWMWGKICTQNSCSFGFFGHHSPT